MQLNRIITVGLAVAALTLSTSNIFAQDNSGDNGGRRRGGGFGGGNFDPAQFQQRMMERIHDELGFTNETDWNAVQPMIQKVMDARRDIGFGGGMRMARRANGGADTGGQQRRNFFGQPSPEAEALQQAIDNNAPAAQIKDLLAKYQASQKAKQAKLTEAQTNLRKVLTVKQEAQATLLGLLN